MTQAKSVEALGARTRRQGGRPNPTAEGQGKRSTALAGEGVYDVDDGQLFLKQGRPVVFLTAKQFSFDMVDLRQDLVHFNAASLEKVAAEHEGALPGPLVFDVMTTPDDDRLRQCKQTIGTAAKTVLGTEPSPLLRAAGRSLTR